MAPLFGWIVDTAHAVVTVAVATMIAMVMIFRISSSIREMIGICRWRQPN